MAGKIVYDKLLELMEIKGLTTYKIRKIKLFQKVRCKTSEKENV